MLTENLTTFETIAISALYVLCCIMLVLVILLLHHIVYASPKKEFDKLLQDRVTDKKRDRKLQNAGNSHKNQ